MLMLPGGSERLAVAMDVSLCQPGTVAVLSATPAHLCLPAGEDCPVLLGA